jgi:two-component system, NtrC family, sensor histidine kinase AtoS
MTDVKNANGTGVSIDTRVGPALLDAAPTGIIVLDGNGCILALNEAAGLLLHVRHSGLIGKSASLLPPSLQPLLEQALASGTVVNRHPVALPDRQLSVTTSVSRQETKIFSVTVELHDLTAAHDMASNLEHLDRLANIGVVTAGVAHEIKNALVAVRTYFELLAGGEDDPELRVLAATEVLRIDKVVRQLLRGARREEFTAAPMSMHSLLQDALGMVRHELQARAIRLALNLRADRDRVKGDERQLRHTIVNLLINAAEAMTEGGQLTVETDLNDEGRFGHLRIRIADTGCGISPENMPRIFSPFFSTKPQGTGLGLAISRRIVRGHQGDISVTSDVGKGTTFIVALPLLA